MSSLTGIDTTVVGALSTGPTFASSLILTFSLAMVIIFLRPDLVSEEVTAAPVGPEADAGPDQNVTGPTLVQFDGTGSSHGPIRDFTWEFPHSGETVTLNGSRPTFFFEHHGTYDVVLTVTGTEGSTDIDHVTITVITVPGEITRVTVIGRNDWVEIDWDEPVHDGGSPIVGCIVYRSTSPDRLEPYFSDWWIRYWSWDYLAANGITYYYAVAALNEVGMGPLSHTVNATPMAVPDSPQNLTIEVIDGAVHLDWDAPLWSSGRVNVTGYQVHRGTDPEWLYDTFELGLNDSFVDEDVKEGVTYYYVVGADSSFGSSSVTEVVNATVGDVQENGGQETSEWWMVAVGFAIIAGLIVVLSFVLKMEARIGKKDAD